MADTSLIWNIIARDKTTAVLNRLEKRASSVGKTVGMALGPALLPVAAVGVGAVTSLGVALAGAGVAAGVFGAVVKTSMTEVTENATKVSDLTDKMALYGKEAELAAASGEDNSKYLQKQADAALELKARLANLPPATRDATMAFIGMKGNWQEFVDHNKPATFNLIGAGYKMMSSAIGQMQPFFDMAASAANRLFGRISQWIAGGALTRLASTAAPALKTLTSIIINIGAAVGRTFGKIGAAQGQGILEWIERLTRKWVEWASATDKDTGINKFVSYIQANGPAVVGALTNLAVAAMHIAQAIGPLAPISMAIASALARLVAAIPPPVITALVAGFIAFNAAMRLYALGSAIATAAQWAMNAALLANPITWIILAIIALIAVIYLVATKTRFFQTVWGAVWGFMKGVGAWFAGPFANFFVALWHRILQFLTWVKNGFVSYFNMVKAVLTAWMQWNSKIIGMVITGFNKVVSFIRSAPGKIRSALSSMFTPLWNGFRTILNRIIGGWNRLHFSIPGFSFAGMNIGGFSVGVPHIPYLAKGAGSVLQSGLAFIHRGEGITPAARVTPFRSTGGGGGATLTIRGDGSRVGNFLLEMLREAIRDKGGDVVKVLAPR